MSTTSQTNKPPYLMLGILFFGAFVSFLNNSLMNVALPSIMIDLGIDDYAVVQWLSTGYMLVSGILIPVSAFLITKFTNRSLFLMSMLLFTLGTVMSAFAPSFGMLLAGRMVQAAGSAVMSPLLMNVMLISFPREKRGAAMGIFGLVMFVAPALGPTLSGYIVEYHHWRMLFEMIIPFALISLLLGFWKLENVMDTRPTKLDYLSVVLSSLGFGGLLYGASSASSSGWSDPIVISTLVAGAIAITLFVWRQLKHDKPMLDLSVYKHPMFALASVIAVVNAAALFSGMILTPAYVQSVRGIAPLDSGLMMLPGALIMGIMSPITGKLFDKFGPRKMALVGMTITAVGTFLLSDLQMDTAISYIVFLYSLRMFGISLVMMPIMTNGLNQLPTRLNPHGTAVNNTIQQVAGAIGTALFVTIMNAQADKKAAKLLVGLDPSVIDQAQMAEITRTALLSGVRFSFLIAAITTVVALVLSLFVKRVDVSAAAVAKLERDSA